MCEKSIIYWNQSTYIGCGPIPGCQWPYNMFRLRDPKLNLHLPLESWERATPKTYKPKSCCKCWKPHLQNSVALGVSSYRLFSASRLIGEFVDPIAITIHHNYLNLNNVLSNQDVFEKKSDITQILGPNMLQWWHCTQLRAIRQWKPQPLGWINLKSNCCPAAPNWLCYLVMFSLLSKKCRVLISRNIQFFGTIASITNLRVLFLTRDFWSRFGGV